jgi:hypothetical protein
MQRLERLSERALVVPIAAFLLLMPPLLTLFEGEGRFLGIPLLYLYLFGVWALFIVVARIAARRLLAGQRAAGHGTPGQPRER